MVHRHGKALLAKPLVPEPEVAALERECRHGQLTKGGPKGERRVVTRCPPQRDKYPQNGHPCETTYKILILSQPETSTRALSGRPPAPRCDPTATLYYMYPLDVAEPRKSAYLLDERHLHEDDRALPAHGRHETPVEADEPLGLGRYIQYMHGLEARTQWNWRHWAGIRAAGIRAACSRSSATERQGHSPLSPLYLPSISPLSPLGLGA